jgi:23S rRNA (guanosine2251-2'-O)-methyltransferase
MIVRSVVGAGLDGLLWPMSGQPWVNGLVVRAAAGSLFACPILRCGSVVEAVATLQGEGFEVWGLDASGESSVFDLPLPHRLALILGGETLGLSEDVRSQLDRKVRIPMAGPLESLNVAVAAGLVAFHAGGLLPGARRRED